MASSRSAFAILQLLQVPGIGNVRLHAVIDFAKRTSASLDDLIHEPKELKAVLPEAKARELRAMQQKAYEIWDTLKEEQVSVVSILDEEYPTRYRELLGKHAPPLLFLRGNLGLLEAASLGFCGSRKPSEKGLVVARECAAMVSKQGINVVSGYAAGVDMTTHRAALESGGTTTIVMAEGILHFRVKREVKDVWDWHRVLIISQYLPSVPWRVHNAMERNRTICALCKAMVLVEARESGGSIEAGRTCLELGIPLFAPVYEGIPDSAKGNQILLGQGALYLRKSRATQMPNLKGVLAAFQSNLHVAV